MVAEGHVVEVYVYIEMSVPTNRVEDFRSQALMHAFTDY